MSTHVGLLIEYWEGQPRREPVHAELLENGNVRLKFSPGFVLGVAAGDELRMLDSDGSFEVIRRGGNVAVQVFSSLPVAPLVEDITERVLSIGGRLDGAVKRGMVFSVPIASGFEAIEGVFDEVAKEHPSLEWIYGNVYDPRDGVTPLGWWS